MTEDVKKNNEKIQQYAEIISVEDDQYTSESTGKTHDIKVITYKDKNGARKFKNVYHAFLEKATVLRKKIDELKKGDKVGIILSQNNYGKFTNVADINLNLNDKPQGITKASAAPDNRQANIVAQMAIKTSVEVLNGKLDLKDVEKTAVDIINLVNKLTDNPVVKKDNVKKVAPKKDEEEEDVV